MPGKSHGWRSLVGCGPWGHEESDRLNNFAFTFHFHILEKEMATHSSVLAWRIPGVGEPGGLPSMGSHRVGHNWSDLAAAAAVPSLSPSPLIEFLIKETCVMNTYRRWPWRGRYSVFPVTVPPKGVLGFLMNILPDSHMISVQPARLEPQWHTGL